MCIYAAVTDIVVAYRSNLVGWDLKGRCRDQKSLCYFMINDLISVPPDLDHHQRIEPFIAN